MSDGRYTYGEDTDLIAQIADLKRRVQNLESGNRIGATSIDKGALTILDPADGSILFQAGELTTASYPDALGMIARRRNGSPALATFTIPDGGGFSAVYDKQVNIIVSDDGASGQGLARPWLPISFVFPGSVVPSGSETTTSATFATVLEAKYQKQHPRFYAYILLRCSDGSTSGEIQLAKNDGTLVGDIIQGPTAIPLGYFGFGTLLGSVPGGFGEEMNIDIMLRRTAGAGTVGVRVMGAWGIQS
jgi:hypothetical protein